MSEGHGGHDGVCGFCGTGVNHGFITCTGCGATWKTVHSLLAVQIIQASWVPGLLAAVFAGANARENGLGVFFLVTAIVTGTIIALANRMCTTGWFR